MSLTLLMKTSCARGDTICLRPLQVDNIFASIGQSAPVLARWLFKTSAAFELLTLKVVSESRVTWATCANFSIPRPLYSRLRPEVPDRETDVRQKHRLMSPRGGGTITYITKLINIIFKMYTFRLSNKTQTRIWGCSHQLDRLKRQF